MKGRAPHPGPHSAPSLQVLLPDFFSISLELKGANFSSATNWLYDLGQPSHPSGTPFQHFDESMYVLTNLPS